MVEQTTIKLFIDDQLRTLKATTQNVPEHDGTSRNIPVHSVTTRNVPERSDIPEEPDDFTEKLKERDEEIEKLKRENRDLEIDKEVRSRMNDQLEKANDRLFEQFMQASKDTQELSRKYGQLEERVKSQLGAGGNSEVVELEDEPGSQAQADTKPTPGHSARYTIRDSRAGAGGSEAQGGG